MPTLQLLLYQLLIMSHLRSPTHIEIPESCLPLRKRLHFASPTPSQEVGESSAAGAARQDEPAVARDDPYSLDELVGANEEIAPTTLQRVNQRVTDLSTIVEQETTIMYGMMEDAQDDQSQLRGRVNLLYRDRPVHHRLAVMIEREARMVREAWGLSMDASDNAHSDVMSLHTMLVAQHALILDLQAADRRRQGVIKELLAADHKRQVLAILYNILSVTGISRLVWLYVVSFVLKPKCIVHFTMRCDLILDAIEFATELMNKKINTWTEHQADNKRKSDDTTQNNHQQPNKRQNTIRAYAAGNGDRRAYEGPRPLCTKCNYQHDGPCAPKCHKCNRFSYLSRDCRNPPNVNIGANQRGNVCFECGAQGHFKKECSKLKNNNNQGNQVGNAKAQAKVYVVGKAGANPDNNVVTGTFLLNKHYASILFDTSTDRSFVSTAFSSQIIITPTVLDHDYNVELADGRIVRLNTIIPGCLPPTRTDSTGGVSNRFDTWCCTCSTGALPISPVRNEGIVGSTAGTF
nr:hypothetical protein [Tanacetum cinerariifolium]